VELTAVSTDPTGLGRATVADRGLGQPGVADMPSHPRAVDKRGLGDQVVNRIGQEIISRLLQPGQGLPNETKLCGQLWGSRAVLREAVRVLASKGLLRTRSRLGTQVRAAEAWSLLDPAVLDWQSRVEPQDRFITELFGLRRVVEPAVAALAAERIGADDLAALEGSYRDMIAAGDDAEAFFTPDLRFHRILLYAVGNSLVQALGETVKQALALNLQLSLQAPRGQQRAMPLHGAVLDAIRARDPEAARAAMTRLNVDAEERAGHALAAHRQELR